MRIITEN